jgi:hypothetical protein
MGTSSVVMKMTLIASVLLLLSCGKEVEFGGQKSKGLENSIQESQPDSSLPGASESPTGSDISPDVESETETSLAVILLCPSVSGTRPEFLLCLNGKLWKVVHLPHPSDTRFSHRTLSNKAVAESHTVTSHG